MLPVPRYTAIRNRNTSMANPWLLEEWNLTDQGQYVLAHGLEKAHAAAKEAGTTVGGPKPKDKGPVTIKQTFLFRKTFTTVIAGGSSGDGPPA